MPPEFPTADTFLALRALRFLEYGQEQGLSRRELLRQVAGRPIMALIVAAATFAVVAFGTDLAIVPLLAPAENLRWPLVLSLAAAALGSSPLALALLATRRGAVYPISSKRE